FLGIPETKCVKALLMNVDNELVVFFVRGDRDLNESKALKLLGAQEIGFADDALIASSNAVPGFTGPVGLNAKTVIDREVLQMKNFCAGANKEGYHLINVNPRDFTAAITGDVVNVVEGDTCPVCGGKLYFNHGIEVGNTFKLGTKYAQSMNLQYLDQNNKLQYVWMGSYGIGPARAMAALVEQNADENGINWPKNIAPYRCCIVPVSMKNEAQVQIADTLYDALWAQGIDTVLDDRDERPGIKFKDMELIGIPFRITVGRKAEEGIVELKPRTGESIEVPVDQVIDKLKELIAE
ncbi:MAG: proline--tRNA ligase, partial [Solobacterium sp.]|nr:proline--tRNA ligase [Solobacterium sp.]